MAGLEFAVHRNPNPVGAQRRAEVLRDPGFGQNFTDHMVRIDWTEGEGWRDARILPYGPIAMDPAAAVLHYAQEIFEGMKAYRHPDGSVWTFRPVANADRLNRSAARLALPSLPVETMLESVERLVALDEAWVPVDGEKSLYLRPFMFASEPFLGVRLAREVTYMLIACPVGSYFTGGVRPVSLWLSSEYTRAAPGGTGAAKCGGNYASSLVAQKQAYAHGCDQVCFLDAVERRWIEELGGMNLYFVHRDGRLVTPELSGTILEGITRSSILQLAKEEGLQVEERRISIDEWRDGVASGQVTEVFACGTGAVVTPVGRLVWEGGEVGDVAAEPGPVTMKLRRTLVDVQYGRAEDRFGWMHRLV